MEAKLAPYKTEISQLNLLLSNANEREVAMQNQIAEIKAELETARVDSKKAMSQIEQLSKTNTTIEQYKKDAENWRAVALEQLKVMAEVLGLF